MLEKIMFKNINILCFNFFCYFALYFHLEWCQVRSCKNLEIINDVLLQAISTKRNDGIRFLALNSLVDKEFDFLSAINGNRVLPSNLGFLFISSKSDIIEGNDDLKNRIEIIELTESDQADNDYTIDYLLCKIKKEDQSEYTNWF